MQLIPENIDYVGPLLLNQFEIINKSANSLPNNAQFTIMFRRLYDYSLISVHIPSVFLLSISLLTNYANIVHYEANIMVHITTMLVMYTLFQAISVSLPQVNREKLLRSMYWFNCSPSDCISQNGWLLAFLWTLCSFCGLHLGGVEKIAESYKWFSRNCFVWSPHKSK